MNPSFIVASSKFGTFGLIWSFYRNVPCVQRIILSHPEQSAGQIITRQFIGISSTSCTEMDKLILQITQAMEGADILFNLEIARLDLCPPFQQHVLRAEHKVPRGKVTTYQRLAEYLKKPKAARAVGNALANNPFPILIPCHRTIRSDFTLGGYQGGMEMKRILLEQEDHEIDARMRLINPRIYY